MPFLQGDRLQFVFLLLCLPVQYLLTNNIGNESSRTKLVLQLVNDWNKQLSLFKSNIFQCLSLILNVFNLNYLIINNEDNESDEAPLTKIFKLKEDHGFFTTSTEIRDERPPHLLFRVGQVVKHKTLGYKGVIKGWDLQAKAPPNWLEKMYEGNKELLETPHYAVIMHNANHDISSYVSQDKLELLKNFKVKNPSLDQYFSHYDGDQYIPKPKLKSLYPKD